MSRDNRSQSGPGGYRQGGQQPPRQNEALNKYEQMIKIKNFNDDEVMKLPDELGKSLASTPGREGKDATNTQVRKFYNLVRIVSRPEIKPEVIKVKLRTLQAQVAYACARATISDEFKRFFDASLNKVIASPDLKDALKQFTTFFEAFYAYFYYHLEMRKGGR